MSRKPIIGPRDEIIVENMIPQTEDFALEQAIQNVTIVVGFAVLIIGVVAKMLDVDLWWLFFPVIVAAVGVALFLMSKAHDLRQRRGR